MLYVLRKHRRGMLNILILSMVGLLMFGFGLDVYQGSEANPVVIRVGEKEIDRGLFQTRVTQMENRFRQQFGDNYERIAPMLNLEQRTSDAVIDEVLLERLLGSLQITASNEQVKAEILKHPFLQGEATKENYRQLLRATGMNGTQLEEMTRKEVANRQLITTLSDLNTPSEAELLAVAREKKREASFQYLAFSASDFSNKVPLNNNEELQEYFAKNSGQYTKPASVKVELVAFTPEQFTKNVELLEDDIAEHYRQTQENYSEPKKFQFRQIVLNKPAASPGSVAEMINPDGDKAKTPQGEAALEAKRSEANELYQSLQAGKSFAELAQLKSEDEKTKGAGGLVDWQVAQSLAEPLRNALESMEVGEQSKVIEEGQAFYLLRLEGLQERRIKELPEVRGEVERAARLDLAPEYAQVAADDFLQKFRDLADQQQLSSYAPQQGLAVVSSEKFLARGETSPNIPQEVVNLAAQLNKGEVDSLTIGTISYVFQVVERKDSYLPTLDEVRPKVIAQFQKEKAQELAKSEATKALEKLKAEKAEQGSLGKLAGALGLELRVSPISSREAVKDPVISRPAVKQAAFALSKGSPVTLSLVEENNAFYLVELAEERLPDQAALIKERDAVAQAEKMNSSNRLLTTLLKTLRSESDIWIDPNLFERPI